MPAPDGLDRFDLVVATIDRTDELDGLLSALDAQTHRGFRVVVVDQNPDGRITDLLELHPGLDVLHLRSDRGLSRARNAALPHLDAELVAFPDDDCSYAPDLLTRVAERFAVDSGLDGLSGRPEDRDGRVVGRWPDDARRITTDTVWHTANSHTIFLRRALVGRVGPFDESLGLGSGTPWSSGEEIDYLVRALRLGARIQYDPSFAIGHPLKPTTADGLVALGRRDGGSVGYVLARNGYPWRVVARMLARPAVAAVACAVLLDGTMARFHAAALAGRLRGLAAGRRAGKRP
ncbi:MAG TPA: glycosyltransferase family A protein [Gaiella sp.]